MPLNNKKTMTTPCLKCGKPVELPDAPVVIGEVNMPIEAICPECTETMEKTGEFESVNPAGKTSRKDPDKSSLGVLICSAGLVLAFFLPWIEGFPPLNYYALVSGILRNIESDFVTFFVRIILWVISALPYWVIVDSFTKRKNYAWGTATGIIILLTCGVFLLMLLKLDLPGTRGYQVTDILGTGFYLAVWSSIGCIAAAIKGLWPILPDIFTGDGKPAATVAAPTHDKPALTDDPAARLKKLDDLKSQGLVSDSEYEQKRAAILKEF